VRLANMALVLLFVPLHALAQPYAKAALEEDGGIVAGQQIHVIVDVFVPSFFTSPPQFPLFQLPNALVTLPQERSQNLSETVGGVSYSGIRIRYAIVPEVPGDFELPAIEITFGYSLDGKTAKGSARTAPLSFSAGGDVNAAAAFAARRVTLQQTFDRNPNSLKVGDAVVRTILVTAEDTQAIIMPPTNPGVAAGMTQYSKSAQTEDGVALADQTVSQRTETIVYTMLTSGTFQIPEIQYPWYDLDVHEPKIAHLPTTDVLVAPAVATAQITPGPAPKQRLSLHQQRRRLMMWIGFLVGAVVLAWVLVRCARHAYPHLIALYRRILASRSNRLRLLRRSILRDDPAEMYRSLQRWSRSEGFQTLHGWAASVHPALARELHGLEALLYSARGGGFDRRRIANLVTVSGSHPVRHRHYALPLLNPNHTASRFTENRPQ
jgi:hypothetical protein